MLVLFLALLPACNGEIPTLGYRTHRMGGGESLVVPTPGVFMASVGCSQLTDLQRVDSGGVAIPLASGPTARFDCRGVARDSVISGIDQFRSAVAASQPGVSAAAGYWVYELIETREYCWTEGYRQFDEGVWYWYITSYTGCFLVESYHREWRSLGDDEPPPELPPAPGGPGTPPPVPPENWVPPVVLDTLCRSSDDIMQSGLLLGQHGPLSSKAMQDSLKALFNSAIGIETELMMAFSRTSDGRIHATRLTDILGPTDNCATKAGGSVPGVLIARAHTHLYSDGTSVICRNDTTQTTIVMDNSETGGGSHADWATTSNGIPMYVISPNAIFRLDPGVDSLQRGNNSNAWDRNATGCAVRRIV